ARALVADGADSFYRVLTDPRDGAPLEIGRTSYRLTKAQRHWLRLRDGRCPFPGCNNHSLDNDADHLLAWADGGTTGITNLGQPCPKHHRLKHNSGWTPAGASKDKPPGWTSPSGRSYPSEQQDWEPAQWPHDSPDTDMNTDLGLPVEPGWDPDLDLPEELGWGPDADPPPDPGRDPDTDPFTDWHGFISGHPWPDADTDHQGWPAPPDGPYPESFLIQCVNDPLNADSGW
ncbi:MAG: HNH endonuclease signature motif containing protein, partial [Arthrobacter sp.]|nr:HNH endonuclease signature motif containing protein [Arthrobacter sp.]